MGEACLLPGGADPRRNAGANAAATVAAAAFADAIAKVVEKDELAGVGLSFYSQIYVLKVPIAHGLRLRPIAPTTTTARLALAASALTTTSRPRSRPLGRGTR